MTRPAGAYGDFVIRNEAAATLTRPSNCCRRAEPRVQTLWHLRFVSRLERFGSSSVDPLQSLGSKRERRRHEDRGTAGGEGGEVYVHIN